MYEDERERYERAIQLVKDLDFCRGRECSECVHYKGGKRRDWCGLRLNDRLAAMGLGNDV